MYINELRSQLENLEKEHQSKPKDGTRGEIIKE